MIGDKLNEFELQEQASSKGIADKKLSGLREAISNRLDRGDEEDSGNDSGNTRSRLDSLEKSAIVFEIALTPLTPTDDLEDVKAMLNTIIHAINKD